MNCQEPPRICISCTKDILRQLHNGIWRPTGFMLLPLPPPLALPLPLPLPLPLLLPDCYLNATSARAATGVVLAHAILSAPPLLLSTQA
jgi:hypothetical protein